MAPRGCACAAAATLLLGVAAAACSPVAPAATTTLCHSQAAPVSAGTYRVNNNEWASSAAQCITTNGNARFTVTHSTIDNRANSAPGGFPFIYKGCHWGACTARSGLPIQVSRIGPGTVTTSWQTTQPGGSSIYNAAYDIWFNRTPATSGRPDGAELMVWLVIHGLNHPAGVVVASGLLIGGHRYDVWVIHRGRRNTITYVMTSPATSVRHLDLAPLVADAVRRGSISTSWYLIAVEAGFELWFRGAGLATNSFSVRVAAGS
jgi:cellulose 1,4-beta-cellobiosidase